MLAHVTWSCTARPPGTTPLEERFFPSEHSSLLCSLPGLSQWKGAAINKLFRNWEQNSELAPTVP